MTEEEKLKELIKARKPSSKKELTIKAKKARKERAMDVSKKASS